MESAAGKPGFQNRWPSFAKKKKFYQTCYSSFGIKHAKYLEVVRRRPSAFFGVLFIDKALLTFLVVLFATLC